MSTVTKSSNATLIELRDSNFIGRSQARVLSELLSSEEREFFREKIATIAAGIEAMPATYGQDGLGMKAVAHLHYFTAGCDFYITEKDAGRPDDAPEESQWQAFGMANIGYGGELGYICLPEILAAGAELDLYWTPKTLEECRK